MRRADRLFHIVQLIRGRRLTTAAFLAQRLEVSQRSVYRDVADLQHQGVPIEGEAGLGYRLGAGFELPPLMFTQEEAKSLVAAVRLAQAWLDPALAAEAQTALGKILSVLPASVRTAAEGLALYAPAASLSAVSPQTLQTLQIAREAVHARRKLQLGYRDLSGNVSQRVVRPLGCFFWGKVWTLAAWCESRQAFRSFRMDRMEQMALLPDRFRDEPDKSLAQLLREAGATLANNQ
jgi:predicted DNA-binding transcriptional regulator YafY